MHDYHIIPLCASVRAYVCSCVFFYFFLLYLVNSFVANFSLMSFAIGAARQQRHHGAGARARAERE